MKGRRQQSQDSIEANIETESDKGTEGLEPIEDEDFDQGGDDDAWT